MWTLKQVLRITPNFGKVIKSIDGDVKVRSLEKQGEYEEARKIRKNLLGKHQVKHMGPLWRSEGMDQLYKLKNYEKSLEAFENAITCIEGKSYISAMQYGITQPLEVYYGAAAAAICVSDDVRAEIYYHKFCELVSRLGYNEHYQNQLQWLKAQIDALNPQGGNIN